MSQSDLITKLAAIIGCIMNPAINTTKVAIGKGQRWKFVFTKETEEGTETFESKSMSRKNARNAERLAKVHAQRIADLTDEFAMEVMDHNLISHTFLNLNHKDGKRIVGLAPHCVVYTYPGKEGDKPFVKGLRRHKEVSDGQLNNGIYTVMMVPHNWTGRCDAYWRGINFTIQRK